MSKISTYTNANSPISGSDKLIGTETGGIVENATKNFTVQELADFIGGGGPITIENSSSLFSTGVGAGSNSLANQSIFLGNAGVDATFANNSNFFGDYAGFQAISANKSNFFGTEAGYNANNASNSNFLGDSAGSGATNAESSNFLGFQAGFLATNAEESNFLGGNAGYQATNANSSNFIGQGSGYQATDADYSNFFGSGAGNLATAATHSNFIGQDAGFQATTASNSNFIGTSAGYGATNAANSNFIGEQAGQGATDSVNSIFIGKKAGLNDTVNNIANGLSSILIGSYTNTGGYSNSILLGSGVSGTPIANTKANQFMLADTITDVRWGGLEYTLPTTQASANQVLTNDGSGILTWQDPRPYKVYTALLTQNGADNPLELSFGAVTKGVTYQIAGASDGDFTNVGAPNNNENTFFVAINNDVPTSYGSCTLDYDTGAPVATVLENTIGDIWFTYVAVGVYFCYSDGLFTNLKTFLSIGNIRDDDGYASVANIGLDSMSINFFNIITSPFQSNTDGKLNNTPIEIRVYN